MKRGRAILLVAAGLVFVAGRSGALSAAPASPAEFRTADQTTDSPDPWREAARDLAATITARTGAHAAQSLTVRNRSSLRGEDFRLIRRELRAALRTAGVSLPVPRQASLEVVVTLSESISGY